MSQPRLPWFPCFPSKLLGAMALMRPDEALVYCVALFRIYERGGPCPDESEQLARFTGLSVQRVERALERLFSTGKLAMEPDGFTNPFASEILARKKAHSAKQHIAGKLGAEYRWNKSGAKNQAKSKVVDSYKDIDIDIERSSNPPVSPLRGKTLPKKTRLPSDFSLTFEMVSYAKDHGVLNVQETFGHFCDHHRAKGNVMDDWVAAWRLWVRNEIKFSRPSMNGHVNGASPRPGSKEDTRERTQAALAAFAPNDGTYDVRTGPRPREPVSEILPFPQLGKS